MKPSNRNSIHMGLRNILSNPNGFKVEEIRRTRSNFFQRGGGCPSSIERCTMGLLELLANFTEMAARAIDRKLQLFQGLHVRADLGFTNSLSYTCYW